MMKKIALQALIALPAVGLFSYFGQIELPMIILALALLTDMATGLAKAWTRKSLSSKTAFEGVLKKAASFVAVMVGVGVDLLMPSALDSIGIAYSPRLVFGLLVILWLCVNEFVSVLENLEALGVPFPPFLQKLVNSLKQKVEQEGDASVASIVTGAQTDAGSENMTTEENNG